jgi:hypothetical protein
MGSCRLAIGALEELTTFQAALALATDTLAGRRAAHARAYGSATSTPSPAYELALAIRRTVNALADTAGTLGLLDRESAVTTLTSEYIPTVVRVNSDDEEAEEVTELLAEG